MSLTFSRRHRTSTNLRAKTRKSDEANSTMNLVTEMSDEAEVILKDDNDASGDDQHSFSDEDTTTTRSGIRSAPTIEEPKKVMAEAETRQVKIWRCILVIMIIGTGALVSALSYTMLHSRHVEEGNTAFLSFSEIVSDEFQTQMKNFISKTNGLRRAISLSALERGALFPYFSIPNYEAKAYELREQALFGTVAFAPIVRHDELDQYLDFANQTRDWLDQSKQIYDGVEPGFNRSSEPPTPPISKSLLCVDHQEEKKDYSEVLKKPCSAQAEWYLPLHHISPPPLPNAKFQNLDFLSDPTYKRITEAANRASNVVFSHIDLDPHVFDFVFGTELHDEIHVHPHTLAAIPVYSDVRIGAEDGIIGYIFGVLAWDKYMEGLLPTEVSELVLVLRNSCGQSYTYHLHGNEAEFIGEGDLHSSKYDAHRVTADLTDNYPNHEVLKHIPGHCFIELDIYPSDAFCDDYLSNLPMIFSIVVAFLFVVMATIFAFYDNFVQTRNRKVVEVAERSDAIVSSLFPDAVKERLLADNNDRKSTNPFLNKNMQDEKDENGMYKNKPIADLYPEATVLFADIVGFTAWSSVREPCQVFILLETLYSAFDKIADQRRIYKVETVGDCYVAVCGLPQPRKDHAVAMARFARDCMYKMWVLTKSLEATLGPDTGDLSLRMGLHSGPVTAGVLRGERSRFQLFGDTMNTAARMESTGKMNCIQMSEETAELLIAAGKSKWVKPREDHVYAKGKGKMQTFFLEINRAQDSNSIHSSEEGTTTVVEKKELALAISNDILAKNARLIEWNIEVMLRLLKQIVARRTALEDVNKYGLENFKSEDLLKRGQTHPFEEVKEIIEMPNIKWSSEANNNTESTELDQVIAEQLRDYLVHICSMYHENPFHNFEHASHVTMSVTKLLSRIVAPSHLDVGDRKNVNSLSLHDHTYGITSSPLTQFAVIFSAIIHDVDHPGIPNAQLVKEQASIAQKYKNVSIAEQNSVELALDLLSSERYKELRHTIAATEQELLSFRQLVINIVMATDICDKQLKELRNNRWNRAFSTDVSEEESQEHAVNRKATIVLEHLIQASDVAHTMQHWHIYRKWNERFFMECYAAYRQGRAESDPSLTWYKGEIGFFDFYIIPLAKKLKECGVFGVCSSEYLDYAEKNRNEWVARGQEVVNEMVEKAHKIWDHNSQTARVA